MWIRFSFALATIVALAMNGSSDACTTVYWVGGNGTWYLGTGAWQEVGAGGPTSALGAFGRSNGVETPGGFADISVVIDGPGNVVYYNGDTAGDFRLRSASNNICAGLTVSGGATFNMETDVFADGAWMQFDSGHFTVTGAGSLFNRFNTANVTAGTGLNGGALIVGSWKGFEGKISKFEVLDHGTISNKGQFWLGAYGDEENNLTLDLNIGEGASFSSTGALENGVSLDDSAGVGNEGEINFIYSSADSVTANSNDYGVNFSGHNGTLSVGEEGIRVQVNAGGWTSTQVTYEDLWNGVVTGLTSDDEILSHSGITSSTGGANLQFSDYFEVTDTSGSADYQLRSIAGILDGGSVAGDLNEDGFRDGADFGIIASNFGAGAYDTKDGDINWTAASGTGGDDLIDAADIGVLFSNWTGDFSIPDAAEGTAEACYNPATGEVVIDVNGVVNWYIEVVGSASMTGDAPVGLNPANGLITDNDVRIGQSGFAPMSYDQHSLGNVAATGLGHTNNMRIFWNTTLGGELQSIPFNCIPEPSALMLTSLCMSVALGKRRHFT